MSILRICYPVIENFLGRENGRFYGLLTPFAQDFMNLARDLNHTYVEADSFGSLVDQVSQTYDGCIGSMQRNESDVAIMWNTLPILGPNLRPSVVSGADQAIIVSTYIRDQESMSSADNGTSVAGVLDMYDSVEVSVWLLIGVVFAICVLFMRISVTVARVTAITFRDRLRLRLFRRPFEKLLAVGMACALNQHSSCRSHLFRIPHVLVFYCLLTLFGFLLLFYLSSLVKTELVSHKRPTTVDNYEDILLLGVRPIWLRNLGDHTEFEFAPKDSMEHRIWTRAQEMGMNESLLSLAKGMDAVKEMASRIADMEAVLITSEIVASVAAPNVCSFSRSFDFKTYASTYNRNDANAPQHLRGFVRNAISDHLAQVLEQRLAVAVEMGITTHSILQLGDTIVSSKGHFFEVQICLLNKIVYPDAEHKRQDVSNFIGLFVLMSCGFASALILLWIEKLRAASVRNNYSFTPST